MVLLNQLDVGIIYYLETVWVASLGLCLIHGPEPQSHFYALSSWDVLFRLIWKLGIRRLRKLIVRRCLFEGLFRFHMIIIIVVWTLFLKFIKFVYWVLKYWTNIMVRWYWYNLYFIVMIRWYRYNWFFIFLVYH